MNTYQGNNFGVNTNPSQYAGPYTGPWGHQPYAQSVAGYHQNDETENVAQTDDSCDGESSGSEESAPEAERGFGQSYSQPYPFWWLRPSYSFTKN